MGTKFTTALLIVILTLVTSGVADQFSKGAPATPVLSSQTTISNPSAGAGSKAYRPPLKSAREFLESRLRGEAGFSGISHSDDEEAITVFVQNEGVKGKIPDSYQGFPVRKLVTGKFIVTGTQVLEAPALAHAPSASPARVGVVRPLVGGVSISAYVPNTLYAGTLGMVTYDSKILTSAHIIAMNPNTNAFLSSGTAVLQPGSYDGGASLTNMIGTLLKYIPITFTTFNSPNHADAATASILSTVSKSIETEFAENGSYKLSRTTTVLVGNTVRQSGRSSGVTLGSVTATNASVVVYYNSTTWAYFTDQILVNQPFIQDGDSGSCVDKGGSFVGLTFATSGNYAVVSKASYIIKSLGIKVN